MSRKALVLDANILIRAVLELRTRLALVVRGFECLLAGRE